MPIVPAWEASHGALGKETTRCRGGLPRATVQDMISTRSVSAEPDVVVREFLDALVDGDLRGAAGLMAEDVWWENIGLPVVRGRRRVLGALRAMYRWGGLDVHTHHLAVEAPRDPMDPHAPVVVLTERTDVLYRGRFRCDFWVCGHFEILDGRILGWRDYYSTSDMLLGVGRGLLRIVGFPRER